MSSVDDHDAMLVADLQAEHAQLEVTRKAYSEESQAVIKEQKHLISSLHSENEVCTSELKRCRNAKHFATAGASGGIRFAAKVVNKRDKTAKLDDFVGAA